MGKNTILWIAAVVITLSSVYYQRRTGPTYPITGDIGINGQAITFSFPRSHDTGVDAPIAIEVPDESVTGEFSYRRYHSNDKWTTMPMARKGEVLTAAVPQQPPAGKVMYSITLIDAEGNRHLLDIEPVVMRFKGHIPLWILIPHILCMFASMLLGTRTGLEAVVKEPKTRIFAWWTLGVLVAGGLILGPIVQKFAFGAYWTGWPFGHDLTDNKTILAVLGWGFALWMNRKPNEKNLKWYWIAAIVHLVVYMIPHSALGSELDYTKLPS